MAVAAAAPAEWVSPIWGITVLGKVFRVPSGNPNLEWFEQLEIERDYTLYYTRLGETVSAYQENLGATNLYRTIEGADPALGISGIAFIRETSGKAVPASTIEALLAWAAGLKQKRLSTQLEKKPAKSCLKQKEAPAPKAPAAPKVTKVIAKRARAARELKALLVDHPPVPQSGMRRLQRTKRFVP